LPDEPANWYDRFTRFRLLGPSRTIVTLWRNEKGENGNKIPNARWYSTSSEWRWQERAEAWDRVEQPRIQAARLAQMEEARARHLEVHLLQQSKAREALEKLDPATLTPDQAIKLMQVGQDGERRCLEEPAIAALQRLVDELMRQQEGTG